MSQNPPENVVEVASHDLLALADGWDAESAYLKKKADEYIEKNRNFLVSQSQ